MANYISENDIEVSCCEIIMNELGYDEHINLWKMPDDGNRLFGRRAASEVVRLETLRAALKDLNNDAPKEVNRFLPKVNDNHSSYKVLIYPRKYR